MTVHFRSMGNLILGYTEFMLSSYLLQCMVCCHTVTDLISVPVYQFNPAGSSGFFLDGCHEYAG